MPRVPWPPLLLLALIGAATLAERAFPLGWPGGLTGGSVRFVGYSVLGLALGVELWAALRFHRMRTTVLPNRPASQLVVGGPFRVSRNPIYVAHVTLLIALGLTGTNLWMWCAAPLLAVLLWRLAIAPEEAFLRQQFGDAYDQYCARTRRWL